MGACSCTPRHATAAEIAEATGAAITDGPKSTPTIVDKHCDELDLPSTWPFGPSRRSVGVSRQDSDASILSAADSSCNSSRLESLRPPKLSLQTVRSAGSPADAALPWGPDLLKCHQERTEHSEDSFRDFMSEASTTEPWSSKRLLTAAESPLVVQGWEEQRG